MEINDIEKIIKALQTRVDKETGTLALISDPIKLAVRIGYISGLLDAQFIIVKMGQDEGKAAKV